MDTNTNKTDNTWGGARARFERLVEGMKKECLKKASPISGLAFIVIYQSFL